MFPVFHFRVKVDNKVSSYADFGISMTFIRAYFLGTERRVLYGWSPIMIKCSRPDCFES